jgi:hypothetical protein
MFAGTPYAYLHVRGGPWDGKQYHEGDKAVLDDAYARPESWCYAFVAAALSVNVPSIRARCNSESRV